MGGAVAVGEVKDGVVALDGELDADGLRLAGEDVLVDAVFGEVVAVGEAAEGGARHALGVVLGLFHGVEDGLAAVARDERGDAIAAGADGGDLGVEVAEALPGLAHVVEEDGDDVVVHDAALVEGEGGGCACLLRSGSGLGR